MFDFIHIFTFVFISIRLISFELCFSLNAHVLILLWKSSVQLSMEILFWYKFIGLVWLKNEVGKVNGWGVLKWLPLEEHVGSGSAGNLTRNEKKWRWKRNGGNLYLNWTARIGSVSCRLADRWPTTNQTHVGSISRTLHRVREVVGQLAANRSAPFPSADSQLNRVRFHFPRAEISGLESGGQS